MPPLRRARTTPLISLPPRAARQIAETDVLVVGGGPAGLGAAIGAANAGAAVILIERYGFLGGSATAALIVTLASYHTSGKQKGKPAARLFFPNDHGPGRPVIAGVLAQFVERLVKAGGAQQPSQKTGFMVSIDPEIFKLVAMEMLDGAGVSFLFHAFASGVIQDGYRNSVVFETKSGPVIIRAGRIIDCTGDGDVAACAGAQYESGREEDGLTQPMTLMFTMAGFMKAGFEAYTKEHPDQWSGVLGLRALISKATEAGDLDLPREDILLFATPHEREISVNCTRITRKSGTDIWDLTYAEWAGRKQMAQIAAFFRKYVPGFENAYIAQSGAQAGVRETRRILCEYHLTAEDVLLARRFGDVIARGSYPIDIHSSEGRGTVLKRLPPGEAYDIPLRALIPSGIENMLVAGRCISGSHEAQSSYRVTPICMATGHAAGVCAALAVRHNVSVRTVESKEVQAELIRQGAILS